MSFTLRAPDIADAAEIADSHVSTWREAYSHLGEIMGLACGAEPRRRR